MSDAVMGYTGAYRDAVTGGYPLGNGYRVHMPGLMRFSAPDSWSPFGAGGLNPYAYCGADPINHSDPSAHMFQALREFAGSVADKAVQEGTRDASALAARNARAATVDTVGAAPASRSESFGPPVKRARRDSDAGVGSSAPGRSRADSGSSAWSASSGASSPRGSASMGNRGVSPGNAHVKRMDLLFAQTMLRLEMRTIRAQEFAVYRDVRSFEARVAAMPRTAEPNLPVADEVDQRLTTLDALKERVANLLKNDLLRDSANAHLHSELAGIRDRLAWIGDRGDLLHEHLETTPDFPEN